MTHRSLALALTFLTLAGARAETRAEAVKVAYKPAPAGAEYWIRHEEKSQRDSFVTTPALGADEWHSVDTLELVRQYVKAGEEGFLEFTVQPLGKSLRVNGH